MLHACPFRALRLDGNPLTDEGGIYLSGALPQCAALAQLHVSECGLGGSRGWGGAFRPVCRHADMHAE